MNNKLLDDMQSVYNRVKILEAALKTIENDNCLDCTAHFIAIEALKKAGAL